MTTPTEISNLALSQLPAGAITSLDENSIQARNCKLWYQQTLEELLEQSEWRFARKTQALALAGESDRLGLWLYRYAAPSGCALVIKIWDENVSLGQPYDYFDGHIYANVLTAKIEFITTAQTDPTQARQTALFRSALICALAARVCMPITKNRKQAIDLSLMAKNALELAQATNHNASPQRYGDFVPEVLSARMGLTGLENMVFPGPEAVYPDFDPVGTFEGELG